MQIRKNAPLIRALSFYCELAPANLDKNAQLVKSGQKNKVIHHPISL
ncbi:hypothetical protein A79_0630 [Vibrio parahaemolyticus AQ3810]|nr:hypothetical protein A79_0630 [Vibrio parahaemolyticus AQ3810]